MQMFLFYLGLGWHHILDFEGYDHILFVATLAAMYRAVEWRKLLVLVTAFTLGHSLTLALATLDVVRVPSAWVEFLIPLTIAISSMSNLLSLRLAESTRTARMQWAKYGMALFFGLIHGLGFSNFLRSVLSEADSLWQPLLAFNVGLELGQIVVVACMLLGLWLWLRSLKWPHNVWIGLFSGAALAVSMMLMWQRWPL